MKQSFIIVIVALQFFLSAQAGDLKLWYKQPTEKFEEAMPLGNGRIGLMVYGGVYKETLNLNEATLWGGGPLSNSAPAHTADTLQKVRELLFKENWDDASKVLRYIQGNNSQSFVPMGNIIIEQTYNSSLAFRNYRRELDLSNAISTISYSIDTVDYSREVFISAPDQVAVIKLKSSKKKQLNFSVGGNTPFVGATIKSISNNEFLVSGQLPIDINSAGNYQNFPLLYENHFGHKGMRYQYRIKVMNTDGKISTNPFIQVSQASEAVVFISVATSFNGFDKRPDTEGKNENQLADSILRKAINIPYEQLKLNHIKDYQAYFNRLSINLGSGNTPSNLPTDERLKNYKKGKTDLGIETLYFNFGRYLLISASRTEGAPMNLQGIWNNRLRPPWGCNYTVNINLEMNYWPAEMCNLSEMTTPLLQYIKNVSVTGQQIAKNYYNMNGWTVHHNSDIWGHANPVGHQIGDPKWANWSLGSPWLSQHLYEHYRFTADKKYLKETAYPLMKGAAEFCSNWLILKDGYYVTAPSTSPENVFIDNNGNKGVVTIASTMDMQIIWDLYNNLIEASQILNTDEKLRAEWKDKRDKLFPMRIGKEGNLMEWYGDWKDDEPQHRHVSHLFGLHPGREISQLINPEIAKAAKKTLEIRGDGGTGWSKAWKVNFWARLLDGDHAYKMYRELLSKSTLPNLFDSHPPFQIDGNFGGISGVCEMLLQSHLGELHLLPALPTAWTEGNITGMKARGAFTVDMYWKKGQLVSALIKSEKGSNCTIRTNCPIKVVGIKVKTIKTENGYVSTFPTQSGKNYKLVAVTKKISTK